ncbi:hypothetical protein ACFL5Z_03240 [Planctomycetota bacterium]
MRTSVNLTLGVFVILCLSLLASGCSNGEPPPSPVTVSPPSSCLGPCNEGYESAQEYQDGKIKSYRLVISLQTLSEPDRAEYLRGFKKAFDDVNDSRLGQEYADILTQSLAQGGYQQAIEIGRRYVKGQAADGRIQELIGRSVGLSRASSLGWKAGFVEGFTKELLAQRPGSDEEHVYLQAETKYNALRAPLGV